MKSLFFGAVVLLFSNSVLALDPFAGPVPVYREGAQYRVDFPEGKSDKPTVVEFFSFGCPHCFEAEPQVENWLKSRPAEIQFVRIPVSFGRPSWAIFARAWYIGKALKIADKMTGPMFDLIHVKRQPPKNIADLKRFFVGLGVKGSDFDQTAKSFYVESMLRKAAQLTRQFKVPGIPNFVINNRYRIVRGSMHSEDEFNDLLTALALKDFKQK